MLVPCPPVQMNEERSTSTERARNQQIEARRDHMHHWSQYQAEQHGKMASALARRAPQGGQEVIRRQQKQARRYPWRKTARNSVDDRHHNHVDKDKRAAQPAIIG